MRKRSEVGSVARDRGATSLLPDNRQLVNVFITKNIYILSFYICMYRVFKNRIRKKYNNNLETFGR